MRHQDEPRGTCRLGIRDFDLPVRLGVGIEERSTPQSVSISLTFTFREPPRACQSDRIEDTFCYGQLCDTLREVVRNREFHTIENLTLELFKALKASMPPGMRTHLHLRKVRPPVPGLTGGSFFEIDEGSGE